MASVIPCIRRTAAALLLVVAALTSTPSIVQSQGVTSSAVVVAGSAVVGDGTNESPIILEFTSSLIPRKVNVNDTFRLLGLTPNKRDATTKDINDYNLFVQQSVKTYSPDILKPYADYFKVIGSTGLVDARDNAQMRFIEPDFGAQIYWFRGDRAAYNYKGFFGRYVQDREQTSFETTTIYDAHYEGGIQNSPRTLAGSATDTHYFWTGSNRDGTKGHMPVNCRYTDPTSLGATHFYYPFPIIALGGYDIFSQTYTNPIESVQDFVDTLTDATCAHGNIDYLNSAIVGGPDGQRVGSGARRYLCANGLNCERAYNNYSPTGPDAIPAYSTEVGLHEVKTAEAYSLKKRSETERFLAISPVFKVADTKLEAEFYLFRQSERPSLDDDSQPLTVASSNVNGNAVLSTYHIGQPFWLGVKFNHWLSSGGTPSSSSDFKDHSVDLTTGTTALYNSGNDADGQLATISQASRQGKVYWLKLHPHHGRYVRLSFDTDIECGETGAVCGRVWRNYNDGYAGVTLDTEYDGPSSIVIEAGPELTRQFHGEIFYPNWEPLMRLPDVITEHQDTVLWMGVEFSQPIDLSAEDFRDHSVSLTNATIDEVREDLDLPGQGYWLKVTPQAGKDVTLRLKTELECGESGALCYTYRGDYIRLHIPDGELSSYTIAADLPQIENISVTSVPQDGSTYQLDERIELTARFSREVSVSEGVDVPQVLLTFHSASSDSPSKKVLASYESGSGTDELLFGYEVQLGERATGISIPLDAMDSATQAGAILLKSTEASAVLTSAAVSKNEQDVDGRARVTGMAISSDPGSDRTYHVGDHIDLTMTFNHPVDVRGTTTVPLGFYERQDAITKEWFLARLTRAAAYHRGSGSSDIVFRYTVVADDSSPGGISKAFNQTYAAGTFTVNGESSLVDSRVGPMERDPQHKVDGTVNTENTAATGSVTIDGELRVGRTLEADVSGVADEDGVPAAFSYKWLKRSDGDEEPSCGDVTNYDDASSVMLQMDDEGKRIKLCMRFTDGSGFVENLASGWVGPVQAPTCASYAMLTSDCEALLEAKPIMDPSGVATADWTSQTLPTAWSGVTVSGGRGNGAGSVG